VGDVVRTLPAAAALRRAYPGAHLAWLVETASADLLASQPWLDEVIVFPRRPPVEKRCEYYSPGQREPGSPRQREPGSPGQREQGSPRQRAGAIFGTAGLLLRFAGELRRRRFDLVLDFHSILRSALLARLSGAPRRIGYSAPVGREGSHWLATERATLIDQKISRFDRNDGLLRYLAISPKPVAAPLVVDPALQERVAKSLGPGPSPIVIHPGTSDRTPNKRWPAERFAEVARRLAEGDAVPSIVSWGPARDDHARASAVVEQSKGAARLAPATPSLAELAALFATVRLYIGGDTGPMHVASLVGTPVVQLLGPTDPIENAPWRETPSRSLRSESGGMDIEPDEVVRAARALLAERGIDYPPRPEVQR